MEYPIRVPDHQCDNREFPREGFLFSDAVPAAFPSPHPYKPPAAAAVRGTRGSDRTLYFRIYSLLL